MKPNRTKMNQEQYEEVLKQINGEKPVTGWIVQGTCKCGRCDRTTYFPLMDCDPVKDPVLNKGSDINRWWL